MTTPSTTWSTQSGLCVAVAGSDDEDITGEVLRAWAEGIEALFPRHGGPELALGRPTKLTFFSADQRPRALKATPLARNDSAGYRRYAFRFDAPEEVRMRLLRLFNQRRAFRVDADPNEPVTVHVFEPDVDPAAAAPTTTRLRSISSTGVGLIGGARIEAVLATLETVRLRFALRPTQEEIEMVAWIRNRRLTDDSVLYGLEFDPQRTDEYELKEQMILEYVMQRQRQQLQQRLR